ncbi:hypothetical protein RYX36_037232, partial [Vicia faba]
DFAYLYDPNNETAGAFVPAQIFNMHSSWSTNIEGECGIYCNNFNMHNWLGWWLCSSNICKNGNA